MIYKKLQSLFNPERYHGWGKSKQYFEGWYYKVVSSDEKHAFAFIPGIAMDKSGNQQAFIQVLDGKKLTTTYHKFAAHEFSSKSNEFATKIKNNSFKINLFKLNLSNVKGTLKFHGQVPWPNQWYSPGIMGPFAFVPMMECYHGILSIDHRSALIKSYADNNKVEIILQNRKYRLEINVQRSDTTELASPIMGFMDGRISESMTSIINTRLIKLSNNKIEFEDTGRNVGLEVAGNIPEILIG